MHALSHANFSETGAFTGTLNPTYLLRTGQRLAQVEHHTVRGVFDLQRVTERKGRSKYGANKRKDWKLRLKSPF